MGKLKKYQDLTSAIEKVGLSTATFVKTVQNEVYVKEGELYFYLTKRVEGRQILPGEMYQDDYKEKARFVGEIVGQLHLGLPSYMRNFRSRLFIVTQIRETLSAQKKSGDLLILNCRNEM